MKGNTKSGMGIAASLGDTVQVIACEIFYACANLLYKIILEDPARSFFPRKVEDYTMPLR